jgi:hypothetical protein
VMMGDDVQRTDPRFLATESSATMDGKFRGAVKPTRP